MSNDFQGAGRTPGLELWRIENLAPVKLSECTGKFYSGDSYILLKTSQSKSGALSWAIHFWLGAESSQDEKGVAAYKTVELDDYLGGGPVQYREVQGSESELFLSYFKSTGGIEYLEGGVASGFRHVERDVYKTRLLHVKGKRTVKVTEVPLAMSSLNRGDVFILDMGLDIMIFNGDEANKYEKAKGIDVASKMNSDERGGRAHITIVNDDLEGCTQFWETLGGSASMVASLPIGDSDDNVVVEKSQPKLFHVSDASGSMVVEEVPLPEGKLTKDLLDGSDVYIIRGSTGKVYVWVGKGSTLAEKKEASISAMRFVEDQGMPASTPIERVSQGFETSNFKAEFAFWEAPKTFNQHTSKGVAKIEGGDVPLDVKDLMSRKEAAETPVDDGSGRIEIWVVKDFKRQPVPASHYGQFNTGDSYIILYTYVKNRVENYILYFWLGNESTADEKGAAALLTRELDDSMGGRPVQVRVVQGKEPSHFRQLFKGRMIVHAGGLASGFRNVNAQDSLDTDGTALFHIRGTNALNTVAVQVPETAASLNSEDCFVLVTPERCQVWKGRGSNQDEATVAVNVASILAGDYNGTGGRVVSEVEEGNEPEDEFWGPLGGRGPYASRAEGEVAPHDPRMFHASTATGRFRVEEVLDFDQSDLLNEDVFLLDTFTQVFVWIGSESTQEEKDKAIEVAHRFVAEADDGRDPDCPIVKILAGSEPSMFTCHFAHWDPEYHAKHSFADPYEARKAALAQKQAESKAKAPALATTLRHTPAKAPAAAPAVQEAAPSPAPAPAPAPAPVKSNEPITTFFSYEDLKGGIPEGVDPARKEEYLNDDAFATLFGMSKAEFAKQVKWRRDQKKKDLGLF